jgi:hypothetical protein
VTAEPAAPEVETIPERTDVTFLTAPHDRDGHPGTRIDLDKHVLERMARKGNFFTPDAATLLAAVIALVIAGALPGAALADPTSKCPEGMLLLPASSVTSGAAKDKNDNGLVCAKVKNGPTGGPDDRSVIDDIVL